MVKMHHVIVHVLRTDHQVANQLCILGDLVIKSILHGAYRCDAVYQRADAAYALCECPGVARIPAAQNNFETANHGARRISLSDPISIHLRLDAQVTLDSGNRIYNDSFIHDFSYLF